MRKFLIQSEARESKKGGHGTGFQAGQTAKPRQGPPCAVTPQKRTWPPISFIVRLSLHEGRHYRSMTVMAQGYFLESVGAGKDLIFLKPSPPRTKTVHSQKGLDTAWSGVLCMFRHTQGGHPRETVHVAFPKALRLS